ncbi:hypothetical protein Ato02nite_085710 [Paractinoplanes toevensis]|uniref:Phosphatase n=1 Tax=Paractinoplanes toevensis TaxID=571911 RepID=A0A920BQ03_9ACTN|nr:hypothetical protein Ato02nite_085710 [Actinoplanes toevensis]
MRRPDRYLRSGRLPFTGRSCRIGAASIPAAAAAAAPVATHKPGRAGPLTFKPIPPNQLDTLIVPNGYDSSVVIRWGDPVVPGAPAFDLAEQTAQRQSQQFGYNNDFVGVLPFGGRDDRALLVVNHEYTNEELMFPGFTSLDALSVERLRVAMAAHGLSVVEIHRVGHTGRWRPAGGRYNRRITALATPFRLTGPAAGSPLLRTAADPKGTTVIGTLNNCSGGVTPWGTVLSGEENFNQYFVGGDQAPETLKPSLTRYGDPHHRPLSEPVAQVGAGAGALRPGQAPERGAPVRLDRRGRPVRPALGAAQAHRAGPAQARGRQRHRGEERARGRVHG